MIVFEVLNEISAKSETSIGKSEKVTGKSEKVIGKSENVTGKSEQVTGKSEQGFVIISRAKFLLSMKYFVLNNFC